MGIENSASRSTTSDFDCGICLCLMTEPSKAPCSHKFCLTCLEEVLIYKSACPFCRAEIARDFRPKISLKLQEDIKAFNKEGYLQRKEYIEKLRHQNEKNFKVKIIYGNDHEELDEPARHNRHSWCAYVRLANKNEDLSKYISKVTFILRPTFSNPKRERAKAPYEVRCLGWGIFLIPITIEWNPALGLENTKVKHMLCFAGHGSVNTLDLIVDKTLLK